MHDTEIHVMSRPLVIQRHCYRQRNWRYHRGHRIVRNDAEVTGQVIIRPIIFQFELGSRRVLAGESGECFNGETQKEHENREIKVKEKSRRI